MNQSLMNLAGWLSANGWAIPVIGALVFGLAFLLGRRVLGGGSGQPETSAEKELEMSFLKGVTLDRRAAPRRKGNPMEVCVCQDTLKPPMRAWVVDRSTGGLCLMFDDPVQVGLDLKVRPKRAPEAMPWIEITIRSCRPERGQFEVGCQFKQMPNWNELLYFG